MKTKDFILIGGALALIYWLRKRKTSNVVEETSTETEDASSQEQSGGGGGGGSSSNNPTQMYGANFGIPPMNEGTPPPATAPKPKKVLGLTTLEPYGIQQSIAPIKAQALNTGSATPTLTPMYNTDLGASPRTR